MKSEPAEAEEAVELHEQNPDHGDGNDELHAEAPEAHQTGAGVGALLDLVLEELGLELPADHDGHDQRTERHRDALGKHIHEVEPVSIPVEAGGSCLAEELPGSEAVAAEAVGRDQDRHEGDDGADDGDGAGTAGLLALRGSAVDERDGHSLNQGDGGGDGRDQNEDKEDDAEDGADLAHAGEHVLQGDEQKLRAAEGDLVDGNAIVDAVGNGGGDDGDTGQNSDQGIGGNDEHGVLGQALLLAQVGAIGDHGAHSQRQGEEHLTGGGGEHGPHAGSLGDEAALDRVAGHEHELQALDRVGHRQGADDDDEEHHKQSGHADLVELLDAAVDAVAVDDPADEHEHNHDDDADPRGRDHVLKCFLTEVISTSRLLVNIALM